MMKIFSNNLSISSVLIVVSFSLFWGGCAPTDHSHSSSDVGSGSTQVGDGGGGGGSPDSPRPSGDPRDALLSDLWVVFIKPSLEDFKGKSDKLEAAGKAYCDSFDSSKKEALKQAWSEAFKSYRYLAVFPFGGKWKNNPWELIDIYGVFETDLSNIGNIRNVDSKLKDLKNANRTNFGVLGFGALDYAINSESSTAIACKIITVNTSVIKQASEKALAVLDGGVYEDFKTGNRQRFQSGKTQSISAIAARLGQATDFLIHKLNDPIMKKKDSLIDGYYSKDQSIPLLRKMLEGIEKYYRLEDGKTSFRSILSSVKPKSAQKIDKDIDNLKEAFGKLKGNSYEDAIKQQKDVVNEIVRLARSLKSSFGTDLMTPLSFSTDPADSDGD